MRHSKDTPARAFGASYSHPAIRIACGDTEVVIQRPGMTQAQADRAAQAINDALTVAALPTIAIAAE
ncbi:MAG: hypothetical protein KA144_08190 [Xanthomonadaceae bacterium]|nr:hypothetical protein [Xanthomonadaceae bacterium]